MAWQPIAEQTLEAPASSITFNTGLSGYAFYRLTVYVANTNATNQILLRLNNDSGSNYNWQNVAVDNTTVSGARAIGDTDVLLAGNLTSNQPASISLLIAKPASGTPGQAIVQSGYGNSPVMRLEGIEWGNTVDAISRIDIIGSLTDLAAGTSALLEGLAA